MRTVTCGVVAAFLLLAACGGAAGEGKVRIDQKAATVAVPAQVASQGRYDVLKGAIEYLLVAEGGKTYETVFVTECPAAELSAALRRIGAEPGKPAADGQLPKGTPFRIFAEYLADGKRVRRPADEFILFKKTGKPLKPVNWIFTGSRKVFDPETEKQALEAAVTRSLVGLHYTDASPLVQNSRVEAKEENIYRANVKALPKPGTKVTVIFERVRVKVAKGERRVHVFISGRVQGVGFRNFTQREARRRQLKGWVRNLRDGRVEAIVEGPAAKVAELLERLKRGPRYARVEKIDVKDEKPTGEFKTFGVRYD